HSYLSHFQNGQFFIFSNFSFSFIFEHFLLKLFRFQCVSCVFHALCIFPCTFWVNFHWLPRASHVCSPLSPYASHMCSLSIGRIEPLDSPKRKKENTNRSEEFIVSCDFLLVLFLRFS